ncbi:haloalkane dehalogenase [Nocardia sp. NPDC051570]|uniref:haloalkane dehalogenase n=1 Tax=Nocardia sp. NPDC051570 TaxID=3364324 RepID=UPI00379C6310
MGNKTDKKFKTVLGRRMAYVDTGNPGGHRETLVFLHGNPTSSYLWRNIVASLRTQARCVAPDLIGMGDSQPLSDSGPGRYRFVEHRTYLDELLDSLDLGDRVVLVVHDWGSALGFDWANRHRNRIAGIAYMEAIVRPMTWDEFPAVARKIFQEFRSDAGEDMILNHNLFVERILTGSVLRPLDPVALEEYRRPYTEPGESRRPTLTWPREMPIDNAPADVCAIVADYADWLAASTVPKLFINAEPGMMLTGPPREFCRSWPHQREVTVPGVHYIQEDSPTQIADAIADFHRQDVMAAPRV